MQNIHDLTGKQFERLTVLEYAGAYDPDNKKNKQHQWKCKCTCGNIVITRGNGLTTGNTKSCGCLQKESVRRRMIDLNGKKFGMIKVIEFDGKKNGQTYWKCQCDCGNKRIIIGTNLRFGKTKSCGCYKKIARRKHGLSGKPGYKKMYLADPFKKLKHNTGVLVRLSLQAKGSSKKGESAFKYLPYTAQELKTHLESLFESWMNWDNYGGRPNNQRKTWHVDHIIPHSSFNYTSMNDPAFLECWSLSNLRPLEKIANMRKGSIVTP